MGSRFLFSFLVISAAFALCSSQRFAWGPCPAEVKGMSNFNVSRYYGYWRVYAKMSNFAGNVCQTVVYTDKGNGDIGVYNDGYTYYARIPIHRRGTLTFVGDRTVANLIETTDIPVIGSRQTPYYVIATDYTAYAVVYNCVNRGFGRIENLLLLARLIITDSSKLAAGYQILYGYGLPVSQIVAPDCVL